MRGVSVIIPVYNARLYLERCVQSLFNQSLEGIEYVFVDDCSTDESMQVLQNMLDQYPNKQDQVKVIRHAENKGAAAARNTGLDNATGEYIGWVDADDYVESDMFEKLLSKIKKTQGDLVWCNYFTINSEGQKREVKQTMEEDSRQFAKALILNTTQGNIWNKLIKRSVFEENSLRFLAGQDVAEDYAMLFRVLHFSQKIAYLDEGLYNYCHNNVGSISKQISTKRIYEGIANAQEMLDFIKEQNIQDYTEEELGRFKFLSKRKFLSSLNIDDFKAWRDVFPESNYLTTENLLTKTHDFLAAKAASEKWFFIRTWIFLKKMKQRITS